MTELKEQLLEILREKEQKIIPENIKEGVQIFNVVGEFSGVEEDPTKLENAVVTTTLSNGTTVTGTNIITAIPSIIKRLPEGPLAISGTSALGLLANCTALEVFPEIDISNITNANSMCYKCTSLTNIPTLNTSKITIGTSMFRNCTNIIAFQNTFDFSSATDLSYCFADCTKLINAPALIIGAPNLGSMFNKCTSLKTIPSIISGAPAQVGSMFAGCDALEEAVIDWDLTNVKSITSMFSSCKSLRKVDIQSPIGSTTFTFDSVFYNCPELEEVVNFDTSKMNTCLDLFYNCVKLTKVPELDCSSMNYTANRMFQGCSSLESVSLVNVTNKLTRVEDTWKGCTNLKTVSMSGDLSAAYSWGNAFSGCVSLETINIHFTGATSINFSGCTSLKNVNMDFPKATSLSSLFNGCKNIEDVTTLSIPKATNMSNAFNNCTNLKHVAVWDTTLLTGSGLSSTFLNCPNLTNESLNNIMQICINSTKITSNKTLKYIGLTSDQATICQSLANYQAFLDAGWTTGY